MEWNEFYNRLPKPMQEFVSSHLDLESIHDFQSIEDKDHDYCFYSESHEVNIVAKVDFDPEDYELNFYLTLWPDEIDDPTMEDLFINLTLKFEEVFSNEKNHEIELNSIGA